MTEERSAIAHARSFLFAPANRPDRFASAFASSAGCVIIDLEDAIPPQEKEAARNIIATHAASWPQPALVRINDASTLWFDDDVAALAGMHNVAGFMLSKADDEAVVRRLAAIAGSLVLLIETVRGFLNIRKLVQIEGVTRVAFGSVDFSLDSGIQDINKSLDSVRTGLVLESRYAGLPPPIDGVTLQVKDKAILAEDIQQSRNLGFGGKLCIHPMHVADIEVGYSPSLDERDWAQRVLQAVESGDAICVVDGKMVDRPIIERARLIAAAL